MQKSQIKSQLVLKRLTSQDLEQFHELLRYAFQVTQKDLFHFGWDNEEIKQSKSPILENAEVLGWFHNDKLVSQIALYPMQINIYNKIYDMGGITGVATYPEYSGIGLMMDLMHEILRTMRKNKQSISCLYPYSIPYYRSRGWEIVSDKMTFKLADHQMPKVPRVDGMIQRVEINHADLIALHDEFAHKTHGCLIRNELAWAEYWRWDVDDEIVAIYYDKSNKPTGYIVYLLEDDIFKIKEMIYLNEEARYGIWGYINAHQSMFDSIQGANYSNHNLAFLLEDGHIKETTQPYIMARIVDVEQFLLQYPFECIPQDICLSFVVSDPLLSWNNQTFVLDFKNQKMNITALESHSTQTIHSSQTLCDSQFKNIIKLNIQTLSTMLLGYKRPLYLRQIGRLEASDEAINLLEEILPEGKAYFSDYF